MKKTLLLLLLLSAKLLHAQAPNNIERSFNVNYPNGVANQVAYINFPANINYSGILEVTITSGYNNSMNTGVLTKRYAVLFEPIGNYYNQLNEILDATGSLAGQWAIGDFDNVNWRIPIYHLNSYGNQLAVTVKGSLLANGPTVNTSVTVAAPVVVANTQTRQYKTIMQDRVGIGTMSPTERLSVNGNIRAKEIKVETANWPDYVFAPGYQPKSLAELERFIKENRHLPEMPSAKEAEANGISLGEMNAKLLKKIEELTLHLIVKDKQLNDQIGQLKDIKMDLAALKGRLDSLNFR